MTKFYVSFIALIACIFINNAQAWASDDNKVKVQAMFLAAGAECLPDYSFTEDDIALFKQKKLPEHENAACFIACLFQKINAFDDKGTFAVEKALEHAKTVFEEEEELKNLEGLLNTCADVNAEEVTDGEKGCDRARLAFVCLVNNHEKHGFKIDF